MLDALAGMVALRDGEIDARIVEHPLRIVVLHDGRLCREQGRVETDRLVEVVDPDMDVQTLHADFLSLSGCFAGRLGAAVGAGAAIFHEVADERVHRRIVGSVDERAVLPFLPDQSSMRVSCARWKESELFGTPSTSAIAPAGMPFAGLDEQAKQGQAVFLRERA